MEANLVGTGTIARVMRALIAVLIIAATIQAYGPNLFYYFTILSNTLAVVLMAGQALKPQWMGVNGWFRGAVTLYMVITGLVYAVLLAPLGADVGAYAPWANFVHHTLAPAALLIDWLLFPPAAKLARSAPWTWLVFPGLYFTFSMIRGAMVDWFPYPFLNFDELGPGGVAIYAVAILAVFTTIGMFLRWWADQRGVIPMPG